MRHCLVLLPVIFAACASPERQAPATQLWPTSAGELRLACAGSGAAPVVFLAGGADEGSTWAEIVDGLGPDVLTCVFDRPGVGGSDPATAPSTPQAISTALAEVLDAAELSADALLVAHSLGGLTARQYGEERADTMTGAVLLDPTVPDPKDSILRAELEDLGWDPDATIAQGRAVSTWNADVPLTVLSHDPALAITEGTWTEADQERWSAGQREYAALTPSGTQRDVTDATHYVYRSHPEVVLDAIRDVLAGAPAR